MSNYTIFPDGDKAQVSGSSITATSTNINGGTAAGMSSVPGSGVITAVVKFGNDSEVYGSQVLQSNDVFGAFQSTPVALTSVADQDGKTRYTLNGHGLTVGTVINITGGVQAGHRGVQTITDVPTVNTFDTDQDYAGAGAAGSYAIVAGRFASMTMGEYIMRGYRSIVAGGQVTTSGYGGSKVKHSIHKLVSLWTSRVATAIRAGNWNIYTGTWNTAPTVANDFSSLGADGAANPTYAIPGNLTFKTSGNPSEDGFEVTNYKAKTG